MRKFITILSLLMLTGVLAAGSVNGLNSHNISIEDTYGRTVPMADIVQVEIFNPNTRTRSTPCTTLAVRRRFAATANKRRENHRLGSLRKGENLLLNFFGGLLIDTLATFVAGNLTYTGEEESQVIIDLGDRGHGAARVVPSGMLVDGNRGLEAVDRVDIGALHLVEILTGVDRQAFYVLPLPFGEDCIEGQRTLAGPAHAGDDDQGIARDIDVDVLQIVRFGAANPDRLRRDHLRLDRLRKVLSVGGAGTRLAWSRSLA